jgi:threonine dehydrogenase-like Zn-dependent dehydrogenase
MRAVRWYDAEDVRVEQVPDPEILDDGDAVLRVRLTAICGSDLHLYGGFIPTMRAGDILGHEFMGEVVALGPAAPGCSAPPTSTVATLAVKPSTSACRSPTSVR